VPDPAERIILQRHHGGQLAGSPQGEIGADQAMRAAMRETRSSLPLARLGVRRLGNLVSVADN
jgi:hypothetical protein